MSTDELEFVALGGGSEVGRSCHIISYKGKTVMLDAGVHPAYTGMSSLPFYDEYDLSKVDVLLISHFHLDHAASLPYVMQHTDFRGRVFMTHPTKAIYRWLLSDFVKVSGGGGSGDLYTDEDLGSSFARIEAIDFYSTQVIDGIKFTAFHAGHVLGAAMYLIEISGVKLLFTGDYSREEDRHLHIAELPPETPDILICESTYGTGMHQPRHEKERRLMQLVHSTVKRGGRCLLPVFALGTAQELMLILEEYWDAHPELQEAVNVYYASSLARKCMAVYQTFINMMNDRLRQRFADTKVNPFVLRHIKSIRGLGRFDDVGPCVMLASPGMLQNGVSRELLERWAPDPKNLLLITGYSVEGTMARHIMTEPSDLPALDSSETRIPRRMAVEEISFAAHVDFHQNAEFIDAVGALHVILVHGETTNMGRLKSALLSKYAKLKGTPTERKIYNPRNCVPVSLEFKTRQIARTVGSLASGRVTKNDDPSEPPHNVSADISALLVRKDWRLQLVADADLEEYTGLGTVQVMERQMVTVDAGPELVRYHLLNMFGALGEPLNPNAQYRVMDAVDVVQTDKNQWSVEWEAGISADPLADAVLALLLSVDSSRASVKLSTAPAHSHAPHDSLVRILQPHFGDALQVNGDIAEVKIDGQSAQINLSTMEVDATNPTLKQRVSHILGLSKSIVEPL